MGIVSAEVDLQGNILASDCAPPEPPAALFDSTPVNYYGTTVRRGYVTQPAAQIVGVAAAQSQYKVDGFGIVAVIDTGVDPNHPVLMPVLMPGYDFTKNRDSADEKGDVKQSTAAVVDGVGAAWVNQSTAAVVDQSTAAVVDSNRYAAYGHGTMVAGVIHLVAPKAMILPLKAFNADGTGYTSDVIRAIYRAVKDNAKILNMSFSFASPSKELSNAISHANRNDVIVIAAVGNDGQRAAVYPAGYFGPRHGRCLYCRQRCPIDVFKLRLHGVRRRARRGHRDDVSVGNLRSSLGHLVQHTVCGGHCRAAPGCQFEPPAKPRPRKRSLTPN